MRPARGRAAPIAIPRALPLKAPGPPAFYNCKRELPPWQLPYPLRDTDKHRFSALYNGCGKALIISKSIDKGTSGKLRVGLDGHGRTYAIKCFRTLESAPKSGTNAQGVARREAWSRDRIWQEARRMQAASADLTVYDVIEAGAKMYLVHTAGHSCLGPLFKFVPKANLVSVVHFCMLGMAQKIQQMHERGYVHGDVKAHNALVLKGQILLCDFGTTQAIASDGRVHKGLCSTYPAPEQAAGKRYGTAQDVWSLGASHMEMFGIADLNLMSHEHTLEASHAHLGQYAAWHRTLFDERGRFCMQRLLDDDSCWGRFFTARMLVDDVGTSFVLTRMLEPCAKRRATLRQVIDFFTPYTPARQNEYDTAACILDKLAQGSKVQRTIGELEAIKAFNRPALNSPQPYRARRPRPLAGLRDMRG